MHRPWALRESCVSYANNFLRITTSSGLRSPASRTRFAARLREFPTGIDLYRSTQLMPKP